MPTAELNPKGPRRIGKYGYQFEREKPLTVPLDVARELDTDPRFTVRGLDLAQSQQDEAVASGQSSKPVSKKNLYKAIRQEADKLDMDVESNFEANGQPSAAALTEVLGYEVTPAEVEAAMKGSDPEEGTDAEEQKKAAKVAEPAPKKEPRRSKVVSQEERNKAKAKKEAKLAEVNKTSADSKEQVEATLDAADEAKLKKKGITIIRKGKSADQKNSETGDLSQDDLKNGENDGSTDGAVEV